MNNWDINSFFFKHEFKLETFSISNQNLGLLYHWNTELSFSPQLIKKKKKYISRTTQKQPKNQNTSLTVNNKTSFTSSDQRNKSFCFKISTFRLVWNLLGKNKEVEASGCGIFFTVYAIGAFHREEEKNKDYFVFSQLFVPTRRKKALHQEKSLTPWLFQ